MAQNSSRSSSNVEREFFRAMNRVVEPAVAAGFGSPGFTPWGMVVLETTGRNTGSYAACRSSGSWPRGA